MAQIARERKSKAPSKTALPAQFSEAAVLVDSLRSAGVLERIGELCEIRREGGFGGLDVVLFLLVYFAGSCRTGLRPFYADAAPWWSLLAALAGRIKLPSPPSISRALGAANHQSIRPFCRWLLTHALDLTSLLTSPAALHRDAVGRAWQVFHFDPTITCLRQRALPAREGVPDATRRASRLGLPGRAGRKRGEVICSRSVLQHASTAIWLDMRVEPGHGDARAQLASAIEAVVQTCLRIGHPKEFALTCLDGQWGGVPSIAAFRAQNTRFVTRCSRYVLLERPEVRRALNAATWFLVPDSGSGPQRACADAGWVLLEPADDTKQEDGSKYAPERVRLIVTRYQQREGVEKPKRGSMSDEVVYELFITDLDEEGWPPEEVCATYFGRCGQENRFAQEDRELVLDRIYAYEAAGQELASAVGAFVWNWRVLAGFTALPLGDDAPKQVPACRRQDERPFPSLPVVSEAESPIQEPTVEAEDLGGAQPVPTDGPDPARREAFRDAARATMRKYLPVLFRGSHLERKKWSLDEVRGNLICPNKEVFVWYSAANTPTAAMALFRTSHDGTCSKCPLKVGCRRDPEATYNYHASLTLPLAIAELVVPPRDLALRPSSAPLRAPPLLLPAASAEGTLKPLSPALLPAAARKVARARAGSIEYDVELTLPPPDERPHPLLQPDLRRRRHGRCTKAENLARYALSAAARVRITTTTRPGHETYFAAFESVVATRQRTGVSPDF